MQCNFGTKKNVLWNRSVTKVILIKMMENFQYARYYSYIMWTSCGDITFHLLKPLTAVK